MMAPQPWRRDRHPLAGFYKSVERPCEICGSPTRLRAPSGVWIHSFCTRSFAPVRPGENSRDRRRKLGKRPHVKPRPPDEVLLQRLEKDLAAARRRFPVGCVVVGRWSIIDALAGKGAPAVYVVTGHRGHRRSWRRSAGDQHAVLEGYAWRDPNATTTCDVPRTSSLGHHSGFVGDMKERFRGILRAKRNGRP